MPLKEEHVQNIRGKDHIKYPGRLHLAHERWVDNDGPGFSLVVEEKQLPTEDNGMFAAVKARLSCPVGIFEDVGDASPQSVGTNIAPHVLRMASTRAKSRVLGAALNIGEAAVEEFSDGAPHETGQQGSREPTNFQRNQRRASEAAQPSLGDGEDGERGSDLPATKKQLNFLESKILDSPDFNMVVEWEEAHKPLNELTRTEASQAIKSL